MKNPEWERQRRQARLRHHRLAVRQRDVGIPLISFVGAMFIFGLILLLVLS